jgi:Mrp family chromosome partitioning ATPase
MAVTNANASSSGDLGDVLGVLRRRFAVIVLAVVLAAGLAVALASRQQQRYDAGATLLFHDSNVSQLVTGVATGGTGTPERNAATNLGLVSLNTVAARTAKTLGGHWTDRSVADSVHAAAEGQSDLISVTGTDTTAQGAAKLANTYAQTFVDMRRATARDQIDQARRSVLGELKSKGLTSSRRKQLARDSDNLRLLASVQDGGVQLVQPALAPTSASSPRPKRSAVIGALIGLLIGTALAFLLEQLDRRLRRPHDAERALGLPVLAAVGRGGASRPQLNPAALPPSDADAFRRLRASLPHLRPGSEMRIVAVTAAEPGSGKHAVAAHLAAAAANARVKALLIEADPHGSGLRGLLENPGGEALPTVLSDERTDLEASVTRVPLNGDPSVGFDVLLAGSGDELLDSPQMRELLDHANERYDLVVLDVPSVTHVTDAVALLRQADGVVVVARLGRDTKDRAQQLGHVLEHLDVRPLGVVTTFARRRDSVRENGAG